MNIVCLCIVTKIIILELHFLISENGHFNSNPILVIIIKCGIIFSMGTYCYFNYCGKTEHDSILLSGNMYVNSVTYRRLLRHPQILFLIIICMCMMYAKTVP